MRVLAVSLVLATAAWPQTNNSTVRGAVTDQAHAVIPKAAVTVTNTATSVSRVTINNEAGLYVFPGVTPGPYRLTAESGACSASRGTLTAGSVSTCTLTSRCPSLAVLHRRT